MGVRRAGRTHYPHLECALPDLHDVDSATPEAGDAGDGEYCSTEEAAAEEIVPLEREIERLRRRVRNNHSLYRKAYPKHAVEQVQLPEIDLTGLANMFVFFGPGEVGDEKLLRCLISNEVLPLLHNWLWDIIDHATVEEAVAGAFCRDDFLPDGMRGPQIVAAHAYKHGLQELQLQCLLPGRQRDATVLGDCARYAAKIYKCCDLVNGVDWRDQGPDFGHRVSLRIMLTAYNDMIVNQEHGFFGILLDSPLAHPMPRKVRAKWEAKYTVPAIEWEEELREEDADEVAEREDRAAIDEPDFEDKEKLIFLLAYKDAIGKARKFGQKAGQPTAEIDWQDVADVLPGCTAADCRRYFHEYSEMFADQAATEPQSEKPTSQKRQLQRSQEGESSDGEFSDGEFSDSKSSGGESSIGESSDDDMPLAKRMEIRRARQSADTERRNCAQTRTNRMQQKRSRIVEPSSSPEVEAPRWAEGPEAEPRTVSEADMDEGFDLPGQEADGDWEMEVDAGAATNTGAYEGTDNGLAGHEIISISSDHSSSSSDASDAGDEGEDDHSFRDQEAQAQTEAPHTAQEPSIDDNRSDGDEQSSLDFMRNEPGDDENPRIAKLKREAKLCYDYGSRAERNDNNHRALYQKAVAFEKELAEAGQEILLLRETEVELRADLATYQARIHDLEGTDLVEQVRAIIDKQQAKIKGLEWSVHGFKKVIDQLEIAAAGKTDKHADQPVLELLRKAKAIVAKQRGELEQLKSTLEKLKAERDERDEAHDQQKTAHDQLKASYEEQKTAQAQLQNKANEEKDELVRKADEEKAELLRKASEERDDLLGKANEEKEELLRKANEEIPRLKDHMVAEEKSALETVKKEKKAVKDLEAKVARLTQDTLG
ncbi:hypothetical protein LTR36_006227 [Oleoguttula mirabilis]|uniref:Myb-like domain-containing protein n=1 Tax=Oleoguttula mirabilis TaxID=1507867 RepID=A0AAV9JCX3_9PEZI|nr:hypothetical protein LTR36_006227 [Oleoguttula mirabilis]